MAARELVAVKREDEWPAGPNMAQHQIALADVDEHTSTAPAPARNEPETPPRPKNWPTSTAGRPDRGNGPGSSPDPGQR